MGYGLGQTQRFETGVTLKVDPRMVLSSQILELNHLELEQAVESELAENPALERLEGAEPISQEEILRSVAPQELKPAGDFWEMKRSLPDADAGEGSWLDVAASCSTLTEHLQAALLSQLPKSLRSVGEWAIGALDDRGYLTSPDEEIALACGCTLEEAAAVVRRLQDCQPPGVGARNLEECLLLQLRGSNEIEWKFARLVVKRHLDEFAARRNLKLARKYRVLPSVVEAAYALISELTPYPAEGYSVCQTEVARSKSVSVAPDIVFGRSEQGWHMEVSGFDPSWLGVDRFYNQRLKELKGEGRAKGATRAEARHLTTFVQRAEDFIESLRSRRKTLAQIGAYLAAQQGGFLSTADYAFLRPLTRSKIAQDLGLHESTVSRATAGKFAQLPSGEVISFDVFFKPALRVQKMIEEILQTENPGNPLSDERIAALLAERGVRVARRTVNKYRDRTKLLSSRKRRVA